MYETKYEPAETRTTLSVATGTDIRIELLWFFLFDPDLVVCHRRRGRCFYPKKAVYYFSMKKVGLAKIAATTWNPFSNVIRKLTHMPKYTNTILRSGVWGTGSSDKLFCYTKVSILAKSLRNRSKESFTCFISFLECILSSMQKRHNELRPAYC